MAKAQSKVGFVGAGSRTMPHYSSFTPLIAEEVKVEFEGLGLYGNSFYEVAGKKEVIVRSVVELAEKNQWDGVIVSAAPTELLNPGLFADLKTALNIPVTTALGASVAALRAYSARRLLLLTPFEERMNEMICNYLSEAGFTVSAPHPFGELGDAIRLTPDEVYELAKRVYGDVGSADAIYFQGAVLDPVKVLEKIEKELETTVVASNPAMLWYIVSKLGRRNRIQGYGKLLAEWPGLPDE